MRIADHPHRPGRIYLRYRAHYSKRVSVYRHGDPAFPWRIAIPDAGPIDYRTFAEAIGDARGLALAHAIRAIQDGAA